MAHEQADSSSSFDDRVREALNNEALRKNFRGAMDFLIEKRKQAFPNEEELTTLRARGEAIRNHILQNLPDLLEELEANCQNNGIQVHWAATKEEANSIVYSLIHEAGGKRVVKGKSMVSEEIGLNQFLQNRGIECTETDMGEYIVQQDGETPSHIIMPAIHKSKEQIAKQFAEKIEGCKYTENVDELIGVGRKVLREKFLNADVGISGVNFAVAETGTLCLVENEGNGRMCTTIPPVHIALMGIEKVVDKFAHIPSLYSLLTRSATGQQITTYFNMISSPRKAGELDGPEAVHLVLIDNGRSRMFQDEQLRQTLRCIRCGACMNHCPVYTRIGGHAYGSTYPGPIGQVVTPQIEGIESAGELTKACSLNGACGEVCPVNIPLPDLIRRLREACSHTMHNIPGEGRRRSFLEGMSWRVWTYIHTRPTLYRRITFLLSRLRNLLPRQIRPWSPARAVPKPAKRSLHEQMAARHQTNEEQREQI